MQRLTQGSTWAGFGVLFQVLKGFVPPQYTIFMDGATAVAGTIAGLINDHKPA
jgi:hypothetical protein